MIRRFIFSSNALWTGLSALTLAIGCRPAPEAASEFRNAVPRKETVAMIVPARAGQALTQAVTAERQAQPVRGATAELYQTTRGVSLMVNGGGAVVLGLVKAVTHYPPTNLTNNTAVWGPWTEALSPNTWKVTVNRVADHQYEYRFEGKPKTAADSAFVVVLSGTHIPALDADGDPVEGFGRGSFTLDWDKAQTLPEHDKNVGKTSYTYSHMGPQQLVDVTAQFRQVQDDKTGKLVDVDYAYAQQPGGEGNLDFTFTAPGTMHPAPGKMAVKSRWQRSGAGRSDVTGSGGDLATPLHASECWDSNFSSSYLHADWDPTGAYGTEATDCVFATAVYSSL